MLIALIVAAVVMAILALPWVVMLVSIAWALYCDWVAGRFNAFAEWIERNDVGHG